jgi:hypothetical protein
MVLAVLSMNRSFFVSIAYTVPYDHSLHSVYIVLGVRIL